MPIGIYRRTLLFLIFALCSLFELHATHLMGGSMTYEYTGSSGGNDNYHITLKIYRYCDASAGGTAPLDNSMFLGIYEQDINFPNDDKNWFATEDLLLTSSTFINPPSVGPTCNFSTTVCVQEGIFEADISLPPSTGGYHIMVERCCRNGNIANLNNPGGVGQTYYCFIPPAGTINSSPQFSDIPVPYMCTNDTVSIVNNAYDPDGDSLVYSFEIPYSGYSGTGNPIPDPFVDNNPYIWPIPGVLYNPGYNMPSPFGAGGYANINSQTGLTQYSIPNQGFYVVAIEIKEYRNGVLISTIRRDLQLIAIACPPNNPPVLSTSNGSGILNYTITEGQTLCFPVIMTDPNGDSLYVSATGNIFNPAIVNPPATLSPVADDNIAYAQFCWSTDCGQANSAPYQFNVSGTDNGCPPKTTNIIYSITVTPFVGTPQPAVTIMQDPPNPICSGTQVTFTALPTFGGTSPAFQWQLNGVNIGTNSPTYTSSTLNDGDIITVSLTSNSACVTTNTAFSPPVVVNVNPTLAPEVSISAAPAGSICFGTSVTFTAVPVNPGPTPVYQWIVNGANVGANSTSYSSSSLTAGSQVGVSLTASAACPAATSNVINMNVSPVVTPSVTITSNNSGAICSGQAVTFTAWPTNGGAAPTYQWQVNGVNAGANSNTFTSSTLNNGDVVIVILTSSETCVSTPTANSNTITITVTAPSAPSVTINVNPSGPICKDDNVIFTATPILGGSAPTYQWQINGINTGPNSPSFATAALNNGDQVRVILTSSLTCAAPATATSNVIIMTVNPTLNGAVSISVNPAGAICPGTLVTFTANPINGGTTPSFQWQLNGGNVGTNSNTYTTSTITNGDAVRVTMTSNGVCVSPINSISNVAVMTVLNTVNPTVAISVAPNLPVCEGTPLTFTANSTFGGANPVYEWLVNGTVTGPNSPTFTTSSLVNGDFVRLRMISSASCPVPPTVLSNVISLNLIPIPVPAVSITALPTGPICIGDNVTFTALSVNGGSAPIYQWQVNGVVSGSGNTFSSTTLANGDVVRVVLTSNATCVSPATAISNEIIMVVKPLLTPQATINVFPAGPVCDGDPLTFTASGTNIGTTPGYQWLLNGNSTGSNSASYTATLNDGDTVQVVITSSEQCLAIATDSSNIIITDVNPNLTPTVSIAANPPGPYCPGTLITINSTVANEGTNPLYEWKLNGTTVGGNTPIFTSSSLVNGDLIWLKLTSSEQCVTSAVVFSNQINIQISPNVTPDITISLLPQGSVCDGDSLFFTSSLQAGGSLPNIEWFVNGINTGSTGQMFSGNSFSNGDIITAVLTSSAFCALPVTDTSNLVVAQIKPLLTPTTTISANPPGIFCDGTSITYSAATINGGANPSYQWFLNSVPIGSNNDTLISSTFLDGDTLSLQMTSTEQCLLFNPAVSNILIIDRYPALQPEIVSVSEICEGMSFVLTGNATGGNGGPYYYSWNNSLPPVSSHTLSPDSTTTYVLTVNDSCSTTQMVAHTVTVNPLPDVIFSVVPPSATILNPFFDFVDQSTHSFSWLWSFGDGESSFDQNPTHTYLEPGLFEVGLIVTSDKGCVDSSSTLVNVENVVIYYIPNSFTPNNDGHNDYFGPVGYSVSAYDLVIYNRWGQQVFNSAAALSLWDGNTASGNPAPEGVYVYQLKVLNDQGSGIKTGTVTLIR